MESSEFQDENIGQDAKDQVTAMKMRRLEALKRAKEKYIEELYDSKVREIAEKYRQMNNDYDDTITREINEGKLRIFDTIRIG